MLEADDGGKVELEIDLRPEDAARLSGRPGISGRPVGSAAPAVLKISGSKPPVDKVQARVLGRFGSPPDAIWQLPGYYFGVKARLAELDAEVLKRGNELFEAEQNLSAALVTIARAGVLACEQLSRAAKAPYVSAIAVLKERENELRAADAQMMAKVEANARAVADLEKRLGDARMELERAKSVERRAGGPGKGPESAKVREAEDTIKILEQERKSLVSDAKRLREAENPATERARKEYTVSCADFAQFLMDDVMNFGDTFAVSRNKIAQLRRVVVDAEQKAELHRVARETYDVEAFDKGKKVLMGAIAFGVLFLLAIAFVVISAAS
jgi:hypothetical protein